VAVEAGFRDQHSMSRFRHRYSRGNDYNAELRRITLPSSSFVADMRGKDGADINLTVRTSAHRVARPA
jgi:hypothetical protein